MDLDVVIKDSRGNDVEDLKLNTEQCSPEDLKILDAYQKFLSPQISQSFRDLIKNFTGSFVKSVSTKVPYTRRAALLDAADGFKKCSVNSELMYLMDLLRSVNDREVISLDLSKKPFKDLVTRVITENEILHPVVKGRLLESITEYV